MINGAASNESSQTLYTANVYLPPKKISAMYSSIAFLLSPVSGQYLMTMVWSMLSSSSVG